MGDYALRPRTAADLPMMAQWLQAPAVREWWGDPVKDLSLVTSDLDDPLMDQRIATLGRTAVDHVQSYPCQHWPAPQFHDQPQDARAMDTSIGVPAMLATGDPVLVMRFDPAFIFP
jgi:aminoglycoside 6'-N-acetyltransferase